MTTAAPTLVTTTNPSTASIIALTYCRISEDDLLTGLGVQRQAEDTRQLCAARGWPIAGSFEDNDTSAFKGVRRDGYEHLLAAAEAYVRNGQQVVIACTEQSRLWRNHREQAAAFDDFKRLGVVVAAVRGFDIDFSKAVNRMVARVVGSVDVMESEVKSERITRAARQRAEQGKPNARVLFGWRRQYEQDAAGNPTGRFKDVVDSEAAALVLELTRRVADREPLAHIGKDFGLRREVRPAEQAKLRRRVQEGDAQKEIHEEDNVQPRQRDTRPWPNNTIRSLVLRPANIAKRVYRGKVIADADWDAIVPKDFYDRAEAVLLAEGRRQGGTGRRKWLLSHGGGIAECGICHSDLGVKSELRGPKRIAYYRCLNGCVGRNLERVDELVKLRIIDRASQPDAQGILDGDDAMSQDARQRAEAIRARMNTFAAKAADGAIDAEQLDIITAKLRPQLEAAEAEVKRYRPVPLPDGAQEMLSERAAQAWERMSIQNRRTFLQLFGCKVSIMPAKKRKTWDPEEVVFTWAV